MTPTRPLAALVLMLSALSAHAEEPSAPPPPAPAAPALPKEFLEQFLSFDPVSKQVFMGRQHRPLARTELFNVVGRPDLAARSEALSQQRVLLGISAGVVAAAGITTAAVVWSNVPNLNSDFCVASPANYNGVCAPQYKQGQTLGTVALVGGLGLGALLATLAYWSSPDVLTSDETMSLTSQHNAALLKKSRGASGAAPQLHLTPYVTLQGGGMLTSFVF